MKFLFSDDHYLDLHLSMLKKPKIFSYTVSLIKNFIKYVPIQGFDLFKFKIIRSNYDMY